MNSINGTIRSNTPGWLILSLFVALVFPSLSPAATATLVPDGNGSTIQWTATGASTNWACVTRNDGDTSIVQTNAEGYYDCSGSGRQLFPGCASWREPQVVDPDPQDLESLKTVIRHRRLSLLRSGGRDILYFGAGSSWNLVSWNSTNPRSTVDTSGPFLKKRGKS